MTDDESAPIPFNRPCIIGAEREYVGHAINNDRLSGDGPFSVRAQQLLEITFAPHRALLTTSCTSALEMAALLTGLKPNDEIIMPSYTFVSTANAVVLRGARPIFVDVRADTLNLDERQIESVVTDRTRAIWPVHYAGVACEMDSIMAIAKSRGLTVVEDAAQGVFAKYRGQWLGTIGDLGCYSFHESKNFSCGEGGALMINQEHYRARAEILREKGTNRSQFLRGQVDKYTWVDVGSSFLPSDLLAAFLLGQLEGMAKITEKRGQLCAAYSSLLAPLAERGLVRLPVVPQHCVSNHHMYYILVANMDVRTALIQHLKRAGIQAVFHYIPLHTAPVGESMGWKPGMLPVTENISARLLRLPLFYDLTLEQVARVVRAINAFFGTSAPD